MTEQRVHTWLVWSLIVVAVVAFFYLRNNPAPYGRHYRKKTTLDCSDRVGWIVMEVPAPVTFLAVYFLGSHAWEAIPLGFLLLWQSHYLNRTLLRPSVNDSEEDRIPIKVVVLGFLFNSMNGYLNARAVSELMTYDQSWMWDLRMWLGLALFLGGFSLNLYSDRLLAKLKQGRHMHGYQLANRGPFKLVSCPNYLGEIIEWAGWAIATWTLAGLAFFLFTSANLVPRAMSHHRWYQQTFKDYPPNRKAVIPGLY